MRDGRVLVAGGKFGTAAAPKSSSAAELYATDAPLATASITLSPMGDPRYYHQCTLLKDGTVLVTGGLKTDGASASTLDSAEIFQPKPVD